LDASELSARTKKRAFHDEQQRVPLVVWRRDHDDN
jgi:hypothetical protein